MYQVGGPPKNFLPFLILLFIKYDYKIIKLLNKHARTCISKWVSSLESSYLGRLYAYSTNAAIVQNSFGNSFFGLAFRVCNTFFWYYPQWWEGNLRPLRVDLILGTAKSHSEPRLIKGEWPSEIMPFGVRNKVWL